MQVYLDNSATTRPTQRAVEAMLSAMSEGYFNPSAAYAPALSAEHDMTACRQAVAAPLHMRAQDVIFTSGGTESDNLAMLGYARKAGMAGRVLFSAIEHPAILECAHALKEQGWDAHEIPVKADGRIDLDALDALLTEDTRLVTLMQVNNETGAVQPLQEAAALIRARAPKARFHVDGVQGYLRVPLNMKALGITSYALSAHKLGGPKGIGALVCADAPAPRALGGGQERGLRSGTENTPGIAGLRAAVDGYPDPEEMRATKRYLYHRLMEAVPDAHVNGPDPESPNAAPHILNVSFPPVRSQTMQNALSERGVYVGTGSACASHTSRVSHVLHAMGVPSKWAESALRFSLSPETTRDEADICVQCLADAYRTLARFIRR